MLALFLCLLSVVYHLFQCFSSSFPILYIINILSCLLICAQMFHPDKSEVILSAAYGLQTLFHLYTLLINHVEPVFTIINLALVLGYLLLISSYYGVLPQNRVFLVSIMICVFLFVLFGVYPSIIVKTTFVSPRPLKINLNMLRFVIRYNSNPKRLFGYLCQMTPALAAILTLPSGFQKHR